MQVDEEPLPKFKATPMPDFNSVRPSAPSYFLCDYFVVAQEEQCYEAAETAVDHTGRDRQFGQEMPV